MTVKTPPLHIPFHQRRSSFLVCLLLVCGWITTSRSISVAQAEDTENDEAAVAALVAEVVEKLEQKALHPQPPPVIYQKAWLGLLVEIGRSELAASHDFSAMSAGEAEQQFVQALSELAKAPGQRRTLRQLAESAIQNYCRQHDPYTRYTRSEEYNHIQLMSKGEGSHTGMSLNEKDGSFYCYPMPGGPAEIAGVKAGDKLISVDGRAVDGRPLEYIASLIKGAPGSKVTVRVEHGFGRTESVSIVRETLNMPPIGVEKKITGYTLRVRRFNEDLVEATRTALQALKSTNTLTIDLRGCAGGQMKAAFGFAELFLQPGDKIVTIRSRDQPEEVYTASKPPEITPAAIILLQDEGTASAAEMVIAALINTKAQRATSQGPKTYGKGVMLSRLDLKGGGAITITSAELIAPQGRSWDGIGLLSSLENEGKIFPETGLP